MQTNSGTRFVQFDRLQKVVSRRFSSISMNIYHTRSERRFVSIVSHLLQTLDHKIRNLFSLDQF